MVRFCIVIPTSDSIGTLPLAVRSALAVDYKDVLVYVSDNGSTDGSRAYLESLHDRRLRYDCHKERVSKTLNWNRAFSGAPDCEIFVMLHSDDTISADAPTAIDEIFRKYHDVSLVFGNHDVLSLDGATVIPKRKWPLPYRSRGKIFDCLQTLSNAVSVVACAFPRKHFERIGGFDPTLDFYQDMEFFHRLGQLGSAVYVSEKLGQYRAAPDRPQSRLRFYCEEVTWLRRRTTVWPSWFAQRLCHAWMHRAYLHIQSDYPDLLKDYVSCLAAAGVRSEDIAERRKGLPRMKLHFVIKLCLSLAYSLKASDTRSSPPPK